MERDNESIVLTVNEVAKILRISRGSAYEAIRVGQIPSIKIGKRILIPRKSLDALLESFDSNGN